MNDALKAARANFRNQKATVETNSFNDEPYVNGVAVAKIVESKIKSREIKGETAPIHYIMLEIIDGPDEGRKAWLFAPRLDEPDGIIASARNVMSTLGDKVDVPGNEAGGEFQLSLDGYLDEVEEFASMMVDEVIEIKISDRKARPDGSHINNKNGKPWQNIYLQRGLGEDASAYTNKDSGQAPAKKNLDAKGSLNVGKKKQPAPKKRVVKKKK